MSESSIKISDKTDSKVIDSKRIDSRGNNSSEASKNISKLISGVTTQTKNLEIFSNKSNILYDVNDFLIKLQEKVLPKEPIYDLIQNFDEKKLKEIMDTILNKIDILSNNYYQAKNNPIDFFFNFNEINDNNNINNIDLPIIHINNYENINYNYYNFNVNKNIAKGILKRNMFHTLNPTLIIRKNKAIKSFKPKNIGKRKRNKLVPENISFNNNDKKANIIKLKEEIFNEKVIEKNYSFAEEKKIKKVVIGRKFNC
jgi:hypothetical protein